MTLTRLLYRVHQSGSKEIVVIPDMNLHVPTLSTVGSLKRYYGLITHEIRHHSVL